MIPGFEKVNEQLDALTVRGDLISRADAIDAVSHHGEIENDYTDLYHDGYCDGVHDAVDVLKDIPPVEPLTDSEQRIFLAAIEREKRVFEKVDKDYPNREPYEDSLVHVCREIERKVKGALWTR